MKHSIIYKNKNRYASFPLLKQLEDRILIGFFTASVPDHMGIFWWNVMESFDEGKSWRDCGAHDYEPWLIWASSAREISDRMFIDKLNSVTGSYGFKIQKELSDFDLSEKPTKNRIIQKSESLFHRWSPDHWTEIIYQRFYSIPSIDHILTFPRFFQDGNLILIPAYALLSDYDISRCLVWRSEDGGKTFHLWNMFPDGIDGNEMAFIKTGKGILAHIRSDNHPYLMESWSFDKGLTWTYPTLVFISEGKYMDNVFGGPPHLLRLKDGKILCTYGYRRHPMGIRAIVSENEGDTWSKPIVLRDDAGYCSSLHKRRWKNKFKLPHAGNDCGYPVSIQLSDGSILTCYYITTSDRITSIESTKWEI